eukprot:scaffold19022_cov112-Isochrysis_galbana.AAC.2
MDLRGLDRGTSEPYRKRTGYRRKLLAQARPSTSTSAASARAAAAIARSEQRKNRKSASAPRSSQRSRPLCALCGASCADANFTGILVTRDPTVQVSSFCCAVAARPLGLNSLICRPGPDCCGGSLRVSLVDRRPSHLAPASQRAFSLERR